MDMKFAGIKPLSDAYKNAFGNIGATLKANKALILVPVLIGGAALYTFSLKPAVKETHSSVGSAPTLNSHIGGQITEHYRDEVTKADNDRLHAAETGKTAAFIPSVLEGNRPIDAAPKNLDETPETGEGDTNLPPELPPAEAPHAEDTSARQAALDQRQAQNQTQAHASARNMRYIDPQRISSLQTMIQAHLDLDTFAPGAVAKYTATQGATEYAQAAPVTMNAGQPASYQKVAATDSKSNSEPTFDIPSPGTVLYGHFASEVDSRVPGVVIGVIDTGPYAGARVMGNFQTSENQKLMVKFSGMTVTYEDDNGERRSKYLTISALAVNPQTLSQGMATYTNRHMFAKIMSTLATSFMQGIGQAIQQSGSTAMMSSSGGTVISQGERNTTQQLLQAGGQSAGSIGQLLSSQLSNTADVVKIAQNTRFGLLFVGGAEGM